jgi:hypothetical protein
MPAKASSKVPGGSAEEGPIRLLRHVLGPRVIVVQARKKAYIVLPCPSPRVHGDKKE